MTDEAINIAIAEACGWTSVWNSTKYSKGINGYPPGYVGDLNSADGRKVVPNYLNDLNAMHEAENVRIAGQHDMEYRESLESLCGQYSVIYRATAAQRAEAFRRTLNLYVP